MSQSRQESQRRPRGEAAAAKQRQLEAFAQNGEGALTTSRGVVVPDNHNSLKAGARGPLLAEDFILRDKLAHFEHERIPERVAWARGAGAHGYFELTRSLTEYTCARFLCEAGERTPVFVRFSNMTGSQGSADTVRDLRGFAVKFYTQEGNWDLVGASLPVFFVQDAMKLPDFMHALKPEPHHGMPQASSAHDTFWDFASLVPECTHALMWLMSGRALPRSLRMMDGFGVHTFRVVNAHGTPHFAKFHWKAKLGCHALAADEARRIAGEDPDFLRRDLWEAIAQGCPPEWELAVQLIPQDKADALGFDLLDATKLVPEELVPPMTVGRLVLDRNPENFFAEVEQAAFHPGHLVPGIEFTSDPLLQGRLLSYSGSQIARLGGPNYGELPINRPVCPVHALHRDGSSRVTIPRGAAAYEPNTLANGAELRADGGRQGFQPLADALESPKLRRRSASFDDHFSQASLFWASQGPIEKENITRAFQRELWQVRAPNIRQSVVDNLAHVDARLARRVAHALGIAAPDAKAAAGRAGFRERRQKLPLETAPSMNIERGPSRSIATRRVAVLPACRARGIRRHCERPAAGRGAHDLWTALGAVRRAPVARRGGQRAGAGGLRPGGQLRDRGVQAWQADLRDRGRAATAEPPRARRRADGGSGAGHRGRAQRPAPAHAARARFRRSHRRASPLGTPRPRGRRPLTSAPSAASYALFTLRPTPDVALLRPNGRCSDGGVSYGIQQRRRRQAQARPRLCRDGPAAPARDRQPRRQGGAPEGHRARVQQRRGPRGRQQGRPGRAPQGHRPRI
jgi:catalase